MEDIEYLNLRLSNNRLEVNTQAVNAAVVERTKLRYYLDIFVPTSFQSSEFESLIRLEASEVPPYRQLENILYEGAYFPIENYLDSLLNRKAPLFNQGRVFVLCDGLVMPFYLVHTRMNGDEVIDSVKMPIEYVLKGGVAESDFPKWQAQIFKNKLGLAGKFLTWSIDNKVVDAVQPEFLYFLTNFVPVPAVLKLKVKKYYVDGTNSTADAYSLTGVLGYSVYSFSVSIVSLGIDTDAKEVLRYSVWIENENGVAVSEVRSYEVERRYNRNVRYILFNNSLGGFDTLRALGQSIETLTVSRQSAERYYPFSASATFSERIINQVTGERELIVRTGFLSAAELNYLQEVILAKEFYVVSDREFIPLLLLSESYVSDEDDVNIRGREFVFKYANRQYNYSSLVIPPAVIARTKAWRVFGTPTLCYLNDYGIRTGDALFPLLEQYYSDDNTAVVPQTIKKNIPGTEGYIASYHATVCETTPYLNVEIRRAVTYRYIGDCVNPYIGNYPELVIEANRWGSEISQADADAKAEAEFARLSTQAYANEHGACVLMKYLNTEIRRQGKKRKNDCVGMGYRGTTAEIVVAANIFGSEVSQAAADALAEAAFASIDTQAYANLHGTCEMQFTKGLSAEYFNYLISQTLDTTFFNNAVPFLVRDELRIDHGDGNIGNPSVTPPSFLISNDFGAIIFKGYLKMPVTGSISLYVAVADDEWAALYLNDNQVLEKPDHVSIPNEVSVTINATAGEYVAFELKYIEFAGNNLTKLSWSYEGQAKIVVPDSAFYKLAAD